MTAYHIAHRFISENLAPGYYPDDEATIIPATVKSGLGIPVFTHGVVHRVADAAIVNGHGKSFLTLVWQCGRGTHRGQPVSEAEAADLRPCGKCDIALEVGNGPVVYRCFDKLDRLIYIGSSRNIASRLQSHRGVTPWWGDVERIEYEPHATEAECRRAESVAIWRERPLHNKTGQASA